MFSEMQAILDYLQIKVAGIPAISGWNVHRDDYISLSTDNLPAVVIYPHVDKKENAEEDNHSGRETRVLTAIIEIRMMGHPVSTTTLPIAQAIGSALMQDRGLGGLAYSSRINELQFQGEKVAEGNFSRAGLTLDVIYRIRP